MIARQSLKRKRAHSGEMATMSVAKMYDVQHVEGNIKVL
jgi:hypothetical protein